MDLEKKKKKDVQQRSSASSEAESLQKASLLFMHILGSVVKMIMKNHIEFHFKVILMQE